MKKSLCLSLAFGIGALGAAEVQIASENGTIERAPAEVRALRAEEPELIAATLAAALPAWQIAAERSAVVFDRPNGPACEKVTRIANGKAETRRFLTGRPEYVMPVGAGNLAAMVNFGDDALELNLSQSDWLDSRPTGSIWDSDPPQLNSPGHVTLRFPGVSTNLITAFKQRMDVLRGRVTVAFATEQGKVALELFGDRASGALVLLVDDGRKDAVPAKVETARRMPTLAVLESPRRNGRFKLTIGSTESSARAALDVDDAALVAARDAWWAAYWQRGWISLAGDDRAQKLEKWWYANLYTYANVGYAKMPPKFNGGPGLVTDSVRCWGRNVWWQNTRELIWPMAPANRVEFARDYLAFYADCLANLRGEVEKTFPWAKPFPGVVVLPETMNLLRSPIYAPTNLAPYDVTAPYRLPTDDERADARKLRALQEVSYITHVFSSGTELLQQMIDYVRFTGDTSFLPRIAAWLRSQTELYLLLLEKGEDGLYHTHATNVNESWWLADDGIVDLTAARFCLAQTKAHGVAFGFPAALVEAAADRLGKLAPLPRGKPYADCWSKTGLRFVDGPEVYWPCVLTNGYVKSNFEANELYLIHPFAMANADAEGPDCTRTLATFETSPYRGGGWGWMPSAIAAAWLRLPNAAGIVYSHAQNTCKWPYGGGRSPGSMMYKGASVEDTVYMDGTGVMQTGVQELLLQSHAEEPDTSFLTGGPVRLAPCVPTVWSGAFKLRARGGFIVEATFEKGAVTSASATAERDGLFEWIDPRTGDRRKCDMKAGKSVSLLP